MTVFSLIRKNLLRRKLRTVLVLFAVAIAFVLYGTLLSFGHGFEVADSGSDRRLMTLNKVSYTEALPRAYVEQVRRQPGVAQISYASWFTGYYQRREKPIIGYAVEPQSFLDLQSDDIAVSAADRQRFLGDRTGILVGESIAKRYGFHLGDRVPVVSDAILKRDGSTVWSFTVDGIYRGKGARDDALAIYLHSDFLNESRVANVDTVDMIWIMPAATADIDRLAQGIDRMFANSPVETQTTRASEFARAFVAQLGDIALVIRLVVGAAFLTIVLIVVNTMMISFRERYREIAILKAIGFPTTRILQFVLGESLLLAVTGGLLGLAATVYVSAALRLSGGVLFQRMAMTAPIALGAVACMGLIGLIGGVVPAVLAVRLRTHTALVRE